MRNRFFFLINLLALISGAILLFNFRVNDAAAAPIKILNNSGHAAATIGNTIRTLLGRSYTASEFVVHHTSINTGSCTTDSTYDGATPLAAIQTNSLFVYCDESNATTTSQVPYQIFSTSFTANPGDSVSVYNQFASYDITDDYAFTNQPAPVLKTPPTLYTAPGNNAFASAPGVEWKVPTTLYSGADLSGATAANTGFMAWLRFNHPTWNWFDLKAAVRQTATNWATGYDSTNYGFGSLSTTTSNALTDNQILLQPPEVATSTSGSYSQLTFTIYPFRQTRRVKDVLFQFASNPGFQANELTLANITALGGTKITEYTGTLATSTTPVYATTTNAYFVWFTADNATDASANFSRIDTYTILGPLSQNEAPFSSSFDIISPANNGIASSASPTFTWNAVSSYLGISKYQLFIDGALDTDNITGTSATPSAPLASGVHTWYVKAFNGGGAATTTVSTPTFNVIPGYASGYTFYVDNVSGNDSSIGSQAAPWATLAKAGRTAQAGDTVIIVKNAEQPYRVTFSPANSGTSGNQITFRGVDANNKPEIWGSDDASSGWSVYSGGNPNTYQKTMATLPNLIAAGPSISNLTQKTWGSSANALNPGEWFWSSGTIYYRLASGEDISTLHVEASARDYIISSTGSYITYKNIVARYSNLTGIDLSGSNAIAEGVEEYDSYNTGISLGSTATARYCIAARNSVHGISSTYASNIKIYNSLMYGNGTSGANFDILSTANGGTMKNNIASGNTTRSFSFTFFWAAPTITASNNAWDIAGDSHWNTYKGTNNQELVDSLFISTSTSNFQLGQFSPNIDTGTTISGLTTDILGNPIYGTPDIGPYEYQPPYSIISQSLPMGANFRVYKDGKYRMTAATSSATTANMSITPVGGFPSGDYSEWLNVTINSWNTSGDHSKSWTESSSAATSTVHTIGDLAANTSYNVNVDGAKYTTVQSDSGGQATFTYSGGYSTHTFSVSENLAVNNGPIVGALFAMPARSQSSSTLSSSGTQPLAASTSLTGMSTTTSATSTPTTHSTTTAATSPTTASAAVIREKIAALQKELVVLLGKLVALLSGQLQSTIKSI